MTRTVHTHSRISAAVIVLGVLGWPAMAVEAGTHVATVVRACSTQPSGVSVPRRYSGSSATSGPLSLFSFGKLGRNGRTSSVPASRFATVGKRSYRVFKLWAILPPGRRVTLTVPRAERAGLSLAYDPALWSSGRWDGTAHITRGDSVVTFAACPRKEAQGRPPHVVYDGGLLSAGPRCARLEVRADGWSTPRTIVIALGRRRC